VKFIAIFFILIVSLWGDTIQIDSYSFGTINTDAYQSVIEDKSGKLGIAEVLRTKGEKKVVNIGYTPSVFWTKFEIVNNLKDDISLVLKNPRAGTDHITVYVINKGEVVATHLLGDMVESSSRPLMGTKSAFYLTIEGGGERVVATRFDNLGAMDLNWEITTPKTYLHKLARKYILGSFPRDNYRPCDLQSIFIYILKNEHFFTICTSCGSSFMVFVCHKRRFLYVGLWYKSLFLNYEQPACTIFDDGFFSCFLYIFFTAIQKK